MTEPDKYWKSNDHAGHRGTAMKLPRRKFLASGSGRCRAPGPLAHRMGASISDAAGAH